MPLGVVIPAAGRGTRLKATLPKALVPLLGSPLLTHTCRALRDFGAVAAWVVLAPAGAENEITAACRSALGTDALLTVRAGGTERADSVRLGLDALPAQCDMVAVHDAARPCVTPAELRAVLEAAQRTGAAILAMPCTDTVKESADGITIARTVDRTTLWMAQTPQVFRTALLRAALAEAEAVTDEAAAVERAGHPVTLVPGHAENIKITTDADLPMAELLLRRRESLPCG